ncbi:MAG: hypothetical protein QF858_03225 [Candidatus Pacebacteria bacterium]|jgi:hypothetical protein|nr:hypothetical protein [bacterium]MDP6527860.1 hypothetical protein [Candidatus Paceibacterota bacterium]MDP6659786.1 hypothetical protein [Candidatus Paceibacterota bacterium]|tara:strand:- start:10138 stop:10404 length:267 start_codon:yes stop_codon:yes gene_type:complete
MTNTLLENLSHALKESSLSPEEQEVFIDKFRFLPSDALKIIVEEIQEDSSSAKLLYDNYQQKRSALKGRDSESWNDIISAEIEELEKV